MSNYFLANQLIKNTNDMFELMDNNSSFVSILKKENGLRIRIRSASNEIIFRETERYDYEYFIGEIYKKRAINKRKYVLLKHINSYEIVDQLTNIVIKDCCYIPFKRCTVYTYNGLLQRLKSL